ncbi:hypothetical protein [Embleya sp. NBC_00896]|uniref:hypothetical protein n=1 Tax=Embleya sp. NBC_00896 TaxID=2975961 RepID=UPI00386A7504|nr:hypothetical protein OG928_31505 [Embleya sp. NBC_00896]
MTEDTSQDTNLASPIATRLADAEAGLVELLATVAPREWSPTRWADGGITLVSTGREDNRGNRAEAVLTALASRGWKFTYLAIRSITMTAPDVLVRLSIRTEPESGGEAGMWTITLEPAPYASNIVRLRDLGFVVEFRENVDGVGNLLRVEHGARYVLLGDRTQPNGALPDHPDEVGAWTARGHVAGGALKWSCPQGDEHGPPFDAWSYVAHETEQWLRGADIGR